MSPRGIAVVEVLLALTITLLIAGALANIVQPARAVFDRVPAELELMQRGRTALDALSHAVRSAGKDVAATDGLGPLSGLLPVAAVSGPDDEGSFSALTVIVPVANGAQGVLELDQTNAAGAMTLTSVHCPDVSVVCGFTNGSTALVADGEGHFDVFAVAATNAAARRLTPASPLSHIYGAGAAVIEIDQHTFSLAEQADGSHSLIRETASGAAQPMVDFVSWLTFVLHDGVVDIALEVEAPTEELRQAVPSRVFRTSITLRNRS